MKKSTTIGVFVSAILVGCAAGHIVAALPVREAHAGTTPQKWEQLCVDRDAADVRDAQANEDLRAPNGWNHALAKYGQQGWEMTSVVHMQTLILAVCFKRPL